MFCTFCKYKHLGMLEFEKIFLIMAGEALGGLHLTCFCGRERSLWLYFNHTRMPLPKPNGREPVGRSLVKFMLPTPRNEFRKTGLCPDSDALCSFATAETPDVEASDVEAHISECDFCSMEVDLYRRFPLEAVEVETPRIPRALLALATRVLGASRKRDSKREDSLQEIDLDQTCGAF